MNHAGSVGVICRGKIQKGEAEMANNTKAGGARRSVKRGPNTPIVSDFGLAFAVYVLYLLGFFTGFTAIVGAIIAYMQSDRADEIARTHFRFQTKTFLVGLLYVFIAAITLHVGIGGLVLLWWVIWTVVRCTKGLLALNAGEPIGDPDSWLFG
jgi:uncharacterized membrane protein